MRIVILISLTLLGCSEDDLTPRSNFRLDSGDVVSCRWVAEESCGVKLWDCADGVKYSCQNNVEEL